MKRRWFLGVLVGAWSLSGVADAAQAVSEVDLLMNKLVERGILSADDVAEIRQEIAQTSQARTEELAKEIVPDSARNWTWKGDIRLRNEWRNQEGSGNDRNRQRVRFRYGFEGKVSDQLKVNARLATGTSSSGGLNSSTSPDPVSTNQSFDTNFGRVGIGLDLANVEYTPSVPGVDRVQVIGGLMENPLWMASPLVFDSDLSFAGAATRLNQELGPVNVFMNAGAFSLDTDETESASLWTAQVGAAIMPFRSRTAEVLKHVRLTAAGAYHDYRNVANASKAGTDILAKEAQNSASVKDFNEINPSIELASVLAGMPVALYGDWVHNTSAGSLDNDGFQIGMKIGKTTTPWDLKHGWEAGYYFQQLERDAAFDEFVDGDFNDGGTNNRGHVFFVALAVLKHSTLGAKYYVARQLDAAVAGKDHEDRVQFDWATKF